MLITEDYRKQQEALHKKGNYGKVGAKYGPMVSQMVDKLGIDHLLDYGCGSRLSLQETLRPKRPLRIQCYDPGVQKYSGDPIPAEMVVCCDVLEHIEPEYIDGVFDHLEELTQVLLFATVHTGPAGKHLSDGRNAHLIQQPMEWWLPKFTERFSIQTAQSTGPQGFFVIAQNANLEIQSEEDVSH